MLYQPRRLNPSMGNPDPQKKNSVQHPHVTDALVSTDATE